MNAHTSIDVVTFGREPLAKAIEDGLEPLLLAHWKEVAHDKDLIALKVDWARYLRMESAGEYVFLAARRGLTLVGYSAFYVARSLHYMDHIFAMNDVIYLSPEERGVEGIALIVESERFLKALGAAKVMYHVKTDAVLGTGKGDSLDAVENLIDIEDRLCIQIPDNFATDGDVTLGGALRVLGYDHFESHFGKTIIGGTL